MIEWRKSSYSQGNDDGACVELAALAQGQVGIRDSKNPTGPHLSIASDGLAALAAHIKAGGLDR
jgi:hypothetical protein